MQGYIVIEKPLYRCDVGILCSERQGSGTQVGDGGWVLKVGVGGKWTNLCNVVKAAQPCTLWAPPIAVMISTGVGCRLQICRRGDPQRFDSAFAVLFFSLKSGPFLCQDPTPLHPSGSDLSKEGRKTVF